jgi:carbonic anhydrase
MFGWCDSPSQRLHNVPHNLSLFEIPNAVLGCSDARVPANEIMGEECGSVFVVRNVANLVISTDFNLMAALQYAVTVLKVPHIIVCGHYDCGGVRASMERKDTSPPLENWLRNIRDV